MTNNFKVGDRVRITNREHLWFHWTGAIEMIDIEDNITPYKIMFDNGELHWVGEHAKLEPISKEPAKMKIASYEVEVIDRDTAKVGCQQVTRAEVELLLAEMNKEPQGMKPSMMPLYKLCVVISKAMMGKLLVRNPASVTEINDGWWESPFCLDNQGIRVRLLKSGEKVVIP